MPRDDTDNYTERAFLEFSRLIYEPFYPFREVAVVLAKSRGSSPRPDIKTKYKNYFFDDFLSADF